MRTDFMLTTVGLCYCEENAMVVLMSTIQGTQTASIYTIINGLMHSSRTQVSLYYSTNAPPSSTVWYFILAAALRTRWSSILFPPGKRVVGAEPTAEPGC